MKLFIKQKIRKNFIKEKFFVSLILLCIFISFSFSDLRALDPLNSNLSYYPSEIPFALNVVKIFFRKSTKFGN
ncbi:hypothetical protein LEP1GSC043_2807 [Leptospira weilii str. Ecochallenge]|uniref:Uncharacterized protein n=1 Tax=Leptospira weilii str. Ecochallenge TaxID=1049986 RepID=N1U1H4_9LEPT|nr:hypothetical protein LEP1GSC043_2807 [Leptospira weilii str. Ecochallenge]